MVRARSPRIPVDNLLEGNEDLCESPLPIGSYERSIFFCQLHGIRVNGVSPGPIPTEVFMEFFGITEEDIPSLGERFQIPLGRVGTPEDIATAAIYCASPASSFSAT